MLAKFRWDISINGWDKTTSDERPSYWKSIFDFDFDLCVVIGMSFHICVPNFVVIGWSAAKLWRHPFSRWRLAAILDLIGVMLDHKWSAIVGHSLILKFGLYPIYSFGLKLPIHAHFGGFLEHISPNMVIYRSNPKRALLVRKHVDWAIKRENRSNGSTWAQNREKGKDRTVKKVTKW